MSVELHVLFRGKLPSRVALTRAMRELGFPVTIQAGGGPLARHSGYLPMKLRREESGVEFDVSDDRETIEEVAGEHFDPRFERCGSFRWGGDEQEMVCALCAAAALAKLVDGIVLDEDGSLSLDQAITRAEETLKTVKPAEPRYGTRPADIKRYLKPLLELRGDLVVVGRRLLIRPVRHLLRGAFFDRTSDKYRFSITGYVQPLYDDRPEILGYDTSFARSPSQVWQPHFASQLFDSLATDIFDRWGPVTTLDRFAIELMSPHSDHIGPMTCLALAGEWDRAAECVERAEREETNEARKSKLRNFWEQLTTDIEAVCATLHAREAGMVKALKLEHIWEPSPFPVELPAAERERTAEPVFATTPWIPSPAGLWQELPTQAGEVRFAMTFRRRHGDLILPIALSREEAEERHRHSEDYVLAVALPDGLLLMIDYTWHWDRNMPENFPFGRGPWNPSYHIELHGASHYAAIGASSRLNVAEIIELNSLDIRDRFSHDSRWYCYINLRDDEKAVHDCRSGKKVYTKSEVTAEERELATCAALSFGDYAGPEARVRALLQVLGYGDLT